MNGTEYDNVLLALEAIENRESSDTKKFCLDIRDWVIKTREYRHTDLDAVGLSFEPDDINEGTDSSLSNIVYSRIVTTSRDLMYKQFNDNIKTISLINKQLPTQLPYYR